MLGLDFVILVSYVVLVPVVLALYVALRRERIAHGARRNLQLDRVSRPILRRAGYLRCST